MRRRGLLTPAEIRQVRQTTGLSAVEMAHLLSIQLHALGKWPINPE